MSVGRADYERALAEVGVVDINVVHHVSTGSTNDDARALVASPTFRDGTVALVIADEQTKGRGRGGNAWFSPYGSIFMTLTAPDMDVSRLGSLPLGVGTAVAASLRRLGAPAWVKWPNDVLLNGLKVCGILCESSVLGSAARVFIGIGINVRTTSPDVSTALSATALDAAGVDADRPSLVADIVSGVLRLIRGKVSNAETVAAWKAVAVPWWGEPVSLLDGEIERRVTLLDVNPEGQLVVRDQAGVVRSLVSGEVRQIRVIA